MERTRTITPLEGTLFSLRAVLLCAAALFASASATRAQEPPNKAKPPSTASAEETAMVLAAAPERAWAKPARPRKLLVFWRCEGFVHSCIPLACRAFQILGRKTGAYETFFSADMKAFAPENLAAFDAVLFNNTTHLAFADPAQRKALIAFVEGGGGIIGIHAATDNFYTWPEGAAMMGALFDGHPWTANGTWAIVPDDADHPLNRAFDGRGFMIRDEIYQFKAPYSREKLRVLLRLDEKNPANRKIRNPAAVHRTDRDFAVSWIHRKGKGRVFYCSLGHNHEVYWNPAVLRHYLDGIQYALGDLEVVDTPSAAHGRGFLRYEAAGPEVSLLDSGDLGAFRENTGAWVTASAVFPDPKDGRKLAWKPGAGAVVNGKEGRTVHLFTRKEHGDVAVHLEFMVPKGSNSGVYFQGRYEIQILDSWGVETPKFSDCGGIYQRWREEPEAKQRGYEGRPPRVNAARRPGEWQTLDVIFRAPRFDASGRKRANARFEKVVLNGVVIHVNAEVSGPTRAAAYQDEKPLGPLMLQGDHGPVAYRNIWITPLKP